MVSVSGNKSQGSSASVQSNSSTPSPSRGKNYSSASKRKEVDYYLNPTELFRWINYRRWDGAKTRALSHSDECSTWIVSRHSSDGRTLWRHLPLHLVCMQSETGMSNDEKNTTRQIEELVDVLLEAYPDAANSPDDQGMLPLHLTVANSEQPNERILNLLLMAYPAGVDMKDKYGRTPIDIVNEKAPSGPHRDAALRSMARARTTMNRITQATRDENTAAVAAIKQASSNERMASQRIIMRLEDELETVRKQLEVQEHKNRDGEGSVHKLAQQIEQLKRENESTQSMVNTVKRERDDLVHQNEILHNQVHEHERIVQSLHQEFEGDRQERADAMAKLKSEVSTSKAMAEALESQLRSRFTNEEYLTTTVSELETQLSDLKTEFQQETSQLMHERDAYENENTQLKRQVDDLVKKTTALQAKLTEVNKQMSDVLSSHGALNSEHDRMMEAGMRTETDLVETMRAERAQILEHIRKQWDFFQSTVKEQEEMLGDFQQKEIALLDFAKDERGRSLKVISSMRQDFQVARAAAMERNRTLQVENLVSSIPGVSKSPRSSGDSSKASLSKDARSMSPSRGSSNHTGRKAAAPSDADHSILRNKKSMSSFQKSTASSYTSRPSRPPAHPVLESRVPSSTDLSSGDRRQGPTLAEQMDGNLLHLLESRADQGIGRHGVNSGTESTSYGASTASSGLTSIYQNPGVNRNKPRIVNFGASTATSSSSIHGNASRTSALSLPNPTTNARKVVTMSIDEYSSGSSPSASMDDSETDSSSKGGSIPSQHQDRGSQYSGMTAGMRMGMIRISEETGEPEIDNNRYSRQ